mgnify:CR=1 FL=1
MGVTKFGSLLSESFLKKLYLIIFFSLIVGLLEVVAISSIIPFVRYFDKIDEIIGHRLNQNTIISGYLFFLILVYFLRYVYTSTSLMLLAKFANYISISIIQKYTYIKNIKKIEISSSELINLVNQNTGIIVYQYIQSILNLANGISIIIFMSIVGVYVNYILYICLLTVLSLVYFLVYQIAKNNLEKFGVVRVVEGERLVKNIAELKGSYKELLTYDKLLEFVQRIKNNSLNHKLALAKTQIQVYVPKIVLELLMYLTLLLVFSIMSIGQSAVTVDEVLLFGALSIKLLPVAQTVFSSISMIKNSKPAYENLEDYNLFCQLNAEKIFKSKKIIGFDYIESKNLSYFINNRCILSNYKFRIDAGKKYLVRGPSGSGKTSFIDLLVGFNKEYSGDVYIKCGANSHQLSSVDLNCSYTSQNAIFISGSLLDNVTYGNENRQDLKYIEDLYNLLALDEIVCFSKSDTYKIEEFGANLSGGQKQRIAILRALVSERKLLFFDECTANLDKNLENKVYQYLSTLNDVTIVAISHSDGIEKYFDETIMVGVSD